MKKILDYLGYFLIAATITIIILGIGYFIIQLWPLIILCVLYIAFFEVKNYCKEKNRSPWKIILNLK